MIRFVPQPIFQPTIQICIYPKDTIVKAIRRMKEVILRNENPKSKELINRNLKIWILRNNRFLPLDSLERKITDLHEGDILSIEIANRDGSYTINL